MVKIENSIFHGAHIQLEGISYNKCRFTNCTFMYSGMGPVQLENNQIEGTCQLLFTGPAGNTLNFLKMFYGGGGAPLVEQVLQSLRSPQSATQQEPVNSVVQ